MTDDGIVEFIRARLADDERAANRARSDAGEHWPDGGRMLLGVEAKRRIVALMEVIIESYDRRHGRSQVTKEHPSVRHNAEMTLLLLATEWSDHAEYQEAWKP